MKGFNIFFDDRRYQGAGETLPEVGSVIAGFIVRRVDGIDVHVGLPRTKEEWSACEAWERKRRNRNPGQKKGPRKRSLKVP